MSSGPFRPNSSWRLLTRHAQADRTTRIAMVNGAEFGAAVIEGGMSALGGTGGRRRIGRSDLARNELLRGITASPMQRTPR